MFSAIQKAELKSAAAYINKLPPLEEWVNTRMKLHPGNAIEIDTYWKWLGLSLDAYFSDSPNPLPRTKLGEVMKQEIQEGTSQYLLLSILMFQAEGYLRDEAHKQGIPYLDNLSRSDFVKLWAREECRYLILVAQQNHWESNSETQTAERQREAARYVRGQISEEKINILRARWVKEDAKLATSIPPVEELMPFTTFCFQVFMKYRFQLPQLENFLKSYYSDSSMKKITVVNQEFKPNPVRGKGKRRKPS